MVVGVFFLKKQVLHVYLQSTKIVYSALKLFIVYLESTRPAT